MICALLRCQIKLGVRDKKFQVYFRDMSEGKFDDYNGKVQTHSTDVAGNRVSVRVSSDNPIGEELYEEMSDLIEEMVEEHGH
jgi:hypothetical protein